MSDKSKHVDENEIMTWAERKLGDLKPYANIILIAFIVLLALFAAIVLYMQAAQTTKANQWRELSIARLESFQNQSSGRLREIADAYPGRPGGSWALMMAGMYDLRTGMNTLANDRPAGIKLIEKAEETFQALVDSSTKKSTDLQRRSVYSLAYAKETLGKFEEAKKLYQQILDAAPDSALSSFCERGIARCEDPALVAAYTKFKEWVDPAGDEAPGPNVESRPDISVPDFDLGEGTEKNDPEAGTDSKESADDGKLDGETATGKKDEAVEAKQESTEAGSSEAESKKSDASASAEQKKSDEATKAETKEDPKKDSNDNESE